MSLFARLYGGASSSPTSPTGPVDGYTLEDMIVVDGGPSAVTDLFDRRPSFILDGDSADLYRLVFYDDDFNPVYSHVGSLANGLYTDGVSGDDVVTIVTNPGSGASQQPDPDPKPDPTPDPDPQPQPDPDPFHYWGVTASDTMNAAEAKSLQKGRKAARGVEFAANGPAGSFVHYVYPAELGDVANATVSGFSVSPLNTVSLTIDGVAYRRTSFGPTEAPIADTVEFS